MREIFLHRCARHNGQAPAWARWPRRQVEKRPSGWDRWKATAIKWAGAAYLIWLGAMMIARSFGPEAVRRAVPVFKRRAFLQGFVAQGTNPNSLVYFARSFTPTYASWLNQVELVFSKIERDVIARGIFSSVNDLARKPMRYIRLCNRDPRPVRWTHNNPSRRISTSDPCVKVH